MRVDNAPKKKTGVKQQPDKTGARGVARCGNHSSNPQRKLSDDPGKPSFSSPKVTIEDIGPCCENPSCDCLHDDSFLEPESLIQKDEDWNGEAEDEFLETLLKNYEKNPLTEVTRDALDLGPLLNFKGASTPEALDASIDPAQEIDTVELASCGSLMAYLDQSKAQQDFDSAHNNQHLREGCDKHSAGDGVIEDHQQYQSDVQRSLFTEHTPNVQTSPPEDPVSRSFTSFVKSRLGPSTGREDGDHSTHQPINSLLTCEPEYFQHSWVLENVHFIQSQKAKQRANARCSESREKVTPTKLEDCKYPDVECKTSSQYNPAKQVSSTYLTSLQAPHTLFDRQPIPLDSQMRTMGTLPGGTTGLILFDTGATVSLISETFVKKHSITEKFEILSMKPQKIILGDGRYYIISKAAKIVVNINEHLIEMIMWIIPMGKDLDMAVGA